MNAPRGDHFRVYRFFHTSCLDSFAWHFFCLDSIENRKPSLVWFRRVNGMEVRYNSSSVESLLAYANRSEIGVGFLF